MTVNPNRQKNVEKQQSHASAHTDKSKVVNGHKFVDLGLPSGTLWAETNIGAKTEADCGDYFVWGETAPKSNYDEATYKNENALAITDDNPEGNNRLLKSGNDAALSNWGSPCRMSCAEDWKELQNCCEMIPVALYDSAGEKVKGLRLVSKANGNTLTFPLSGLKRYNDVLGKNDYFFISLKDCDKDGSFGTYKGGKPGYDDIHIWKFDGLSVRPVISK